MSKINEYVYIDEDEKNMEEIEENQILPSEIRLSNAVGNFGYEFENYCNDNYLFIGEGLSHDDIYYFLLTILEK